MTTIHYVYSHLPTLAQLTTSVPQQTSQSPGAQQRPAMRETLYPENLDFAMSIAQSTPVNEQDSVEFYYLVLCFFIIILACRTVGEDPCVFPFTYRGNTYNECTTVDEPEPWCSTETTDDGSFISGEWASCNEHCPVKNETTSK